MDVEEPLLRGKTILVVNAGSPQKKFILKRMKELGLELVALHDKEEAWAQDCVDHWILTEGKNQSAAIDAVRSFIEKRPEISLGGAITFWEEEVPLLAEMCREFGFIGNSVETSLNTRSKFAMQAALKTAGRPSIRQCFVRSEADLENAIREVDFPAIIKPLFGTDSMFVLYLRNAEEARKAYDYVGRNCTTQSYEVLYTYEQGCYVFQEYVDGTEFSAECFVQNGIPHVVAIHEKTGMDLPFFLETGDYIPPRISDETYKLIVEQAEGALRGLGVRNSLAHIEMKLGSRGPRVIDAASRMGGYYTYHNVKRVHSFDMIKAGCEIALGLTVSERPESPKTYVMGKFFIPAASGTIIALKGFGRIKERFPQIIDWFLIKKEGEEILVPPEGYESIGWVLAEGGSIGEVEETMRRIEKSVTIEVEPFPKIILEKKRAAVAVL